MLDFIGSVLTISFGYVLGRYFWDCYSKGR